MSKLVYLLLCCQFFSGNIFSQDFSFFKNVAYGKSFIAELRSPITKLEFGFLNKLSPLYYKSDVDKRVFIESGFGYELYFFSFNSGKFHGSLTFPGGSNTLTDMFEKETAPVINTNYWFGIEMKLFYYPTNSVKCIKNIAFRIQPVYHESTHLGDEFALHGIQVIQDFIRINVSYEAYALSFTLNDPDTISDNVLSIKAGFSNLWSYKDGYYHTDTLEVGGADIHKTLPHPEYFLVLNYQRTKGFLCSEKMMNLISLEISDRIKYCYESGIPESRVFSINSYFGWKFNVPPKPFSNVGIFIRYYYGLNPHGQFRDSTGFRFASLSIALM